MENSKKIKITMGVGAMSLLANAHTPIPKGEKYFFQGDLCQMAEAANVARKLGFEVGVGGGLTYVLSKEDYDTVIKYIIDYHVEGYWHYTKK